MSFQNCAAEKPFRMIRGGARDFDPFAYQRAFPARWAAYLRAAHGRDAEAIALVYGVTPRTAANWLAEVVRPTGDKVALAQVRDGARLTDYLTGAAA